MYDIDWLLIANWIIENLIAASALALVSWLSWVAVSLRKRLNSAHQLIQEKEEQIKTLRDVLKEEGLTQEQIAHVEYLDGWINDGPHSRHHP